LRPPGSEWLYLKLYCPPALQDDLIAEEVAPFVEYATSTALTDHWFFIRYFDTGAHLRVRFHGEPGVLMSRLLPQTCAWGARLVGNGSCLGFAFDTYEREVERYGGALGIALAEELFAADSRAVTDILRAGMALDRITLAVLSVDTLLDGLGIDAADRLTWYRSRVSLSRDDGPAYRRRREQLRQILACGGATQEGHDPLGRLLAERRHVLEAIGNRLDDLARAGQIDLPKIELCRSYVHMHCNRLLGTEVAVEKRVLCLASRTLESLSRAPVSNHRSGFQY
jgi:thiopeptide-type bacteriocin biosynthesis protein